MTKTIHLDKNGEVIGVTHTSRQAMVGEDWNGSLQRTDANFSIPYNQKYSDEQIKETSLNYGHVQPNTFQPGSLGGQPVVDEGVLGIIGIIIAVCLVVSLCGGWFLLGGIK